MIVCAGQSSRQLLTQPLSRYEKVSYALHSSPACAGRLVACRRHCGRRFSFERAAQDQGTVPADRHDDDNGFDKGWLGLLGLAGLVGLKRRDRDDVHQRDATGNDANRGTTARV